MWDGKRLTFGAIIGGTTLEVGRWLFEKVLDKAWPGVTAVISDIPPYLFASFAVGALFSYITLGGWKVLFKREDSQHAEKPSQRHLKEELLFTHEGLFVGDINISGDNLERHILTIKVSGFNATGCSIEIKDARGNITACHIDGRSFGALTPPRLARELLVDNIEISNLCGFAFTLEQHVDDKLIEAISTSDEKSLIHLYFEGLTVQVGAIGNSGFVARVPLWGGATLHKSSNELITHSLRIGRSSGTW